jgi:hemerythrin-like domain-containing protein
MFGKGKGSSGMKWGLIGGAIAGGVSLIPLVPVLRRRAMRATTILKKDHRMVSGLIATLEMTPRMNTGLRKTLFDQIHHSLMVHTQVEEEIFYPAVRNIGFGQGEQQVNQAFREHQTVKDLLSRMSNMNTTTAEFEATVGELKRNIQHHVDEEENRMFPLVISRMSDEQLESIGTRMHNRKKDLKQHRAA